MRHEAQRNSCDANALVHRRLLRCHGQSHQNPGPSSCRGGRQRWAVLAGSGTDGGRLKKTLGPIKQVVRRGMQEMQAGLSMDRRELTGSLMTMPIAMDATPGNKDCHLTDLQANRQPEWMRCDMMMRQGPWQAYDAAASLAAIPDGSSVQHSSSGFRHNDDRPPHHDAD